MGSGIKVADVMKKNVVTLHANATVQEAARVMKDKGIGSIIVIEGNEAKGILTERDIVRKVVAEMKPLTTRVKDVMSHPLIVVEPETALEDAARVMHDNNIRRLPVINREGLLVGILTENDIMSLFPTIVDLIEEKARL